MCTGSLLRQAENTGESLVMHSVAQRCILSPSGIITYAIASRTLQTIQRLHRANNAVHDFKRLYLNVNISKSGEKYKKKEENCQRSARS